MNIAKMKKKYAQGFTLVELMIVVAIIGILAVLAVYGVTKYMQNAKTGEARNALGQLAKAAVGAYEEERAEATLLAPGAAGANNLHQVCGTATARVPGAISNVANKKYQSSQQTGADWALGDKNNGWPCLKFALTEPQYFQYAYLADTASNGFNAIADGALKGGATADLGFNITGKVVGATKQMTVAQNINETQGPAPTALP
jgi:type IV pilus assembly protein PilA